MKWRRWVWCQILRAFTFGRLGHQFKAARDDQHMTVSYCRRCGAVEIEEHR